MFKDKKKKEIDQRSHSTVSKLKEFEENQKTTRIRRKFDERSRWLNSELWEPGVETGLEIKAPNNYQGISYS